ncbi:T-complex protein 11-domain-containing protein [Chytridium lagenaria]|nr:T-complex protein 11-domain-containing protein [Chytridium lagenaria]
MKQSSQKSSSAKRSASASSAKKSAWKNPSRVFLSSFIIVEYTNEIMPTIAAEEETVKKHAVELLAKFQEWLDRVETISDQELLEATVALLKIWVTYYESFNTWKERDTKKIVDDLVSHWMNLEKLWLSVKEQVDADTNGARVSSSSKKSSLIVSVALANLHLNVYARKGGYPFHLMLARTWTLMRTWRCPPPVLPPLLLSRSLVRQPVVLAQLYLPHLWICFPPLPKGSRPSSLENELIPSTPQPVGPRLVLPLPRNMPDETITRPLTPASLPDEMLTSKKSMDAKESLDLTSVASSFGSTLSNEQLAHELTLDPDFSLKKPQLSELEEAIRTQARKAFFDSVQQAFDRKEFIYYVPDFIEDIRKQILAMVSEKGKIAAEIKEVLDIELIKQQIDKKVVNLKSLLTYIVSKMAQLCAPIRDSAMRSVTAHVAALPESPFTDAAEPLSRLSSIFDAILVILDDMRLDLANFRLQSLRPHLRPQAAEYERGKFATALERGEITLDRTKQWLSDSAKEKEGVAKARNPEGVDIPENRVRYTDIFHEAALGLVFSPPATGSHDAVLPETLLLDASRLRKFQEEAQKLNVVAALLTLTQNTVGEIRGDRAALLGLKDALLILLSDTEGLEVDHLSAQIISSVSSSIASRRAAVNAATGRQVHAEATLPGSSGSVLGAREDIIKTMVAKILSPGAKDPILSLLRRRLQASVKTHVASGTFKREGLERAGLDLIKTELEAYSLKVATWVRFNGEVYSDWYDEILREVVG